MEILYLTMKHIKKKHSYKTDAAFSSPKSFALNWSRSHPWRDGMTTPIYFVNISTISYYYLFRVIEHQKEWQYIINLCFTSLSGDYLHTNTLHTCRDRWLEEFDFSAIFSRVFGKDSPQIAWYPERRRKSNVINSSQAELKIISTFFFLSAAPCRSPCIKH